MNRIASATVLYTILSGIWAKAALSSLVLTSLRRRSSSQPSPNPTEIASTAQTTDYVYPMSAKRSFAMALLIQILLILLSFPVMAQGNEKAKEPVFFFATSAEVSMYGRDRPSVGGGLTIGLDGRIAIGLRCLYFYDLSYNALDDKRVDALETTVFFRVYLLRNKICTGLFLQLNLGPVIILSEDDWSIPAVGTGSAGLTVGWRIPFGNYFYIEPAIRGGAPFFVGGGLSAGFRF